MQNNKRKAAFFDVDGTIISIKSLVSFVQYLEINNDAEVPLPALSIFVKNLQEKLCSESQRRQLNRHYFSIYKNISHMAITRVANKWFPDVEKSEGFYIEESIKEIKRLKREGHFIVLVTGSFLPLLLTLKERLGADDIICTTPECIDGIYTGELIGNPCIGEYKRTRVMAYAIENNIDLSKSYAFGDDDSDLYMLQTVGNGVRVASNSTY
jgi:HAD superfamily hydrolase (TIGR01490 family)